MLSTCANPTCRAPFQYLREGRLFKFELASGPELVGSRKFPRKIEHFWLCGQCAGKMTLALQDQTHVIVVPRRDYQFRRAAAS